MIAVCKKCGEHDWYWYKGRKIAREVPKGKELTCSSCVQKSLHNLVPRVEEGNESKPAIR